MIIIKTENESTKVYRTQTGFKDPEKLREILDKFEEHAKVYPESEFLELMRNVQNEVRK